MCRASTRANSFAGSLRNPQFSGTSDAQMNKPVLVDKGVPSSDLFRHSTGTPPDCNFPPGAFRNGVGSGPWSHSTVAWSRDSAAAGALSGSLPSKGHQTRSSPGGLARPRHLWFGLVVRGEAHAPRQKKAQTSNSQGTRFSGTSKNLRAQITEQVKQPGRVTIEP